MNKKPVIPATVCLLIGLVASCASIFEGLPTPSPSVSPTPVMTSKPSPTPSPVASAYPIKGWPESYNEMIRKSVPKTLMELKALDFCPNYSKMDEKGKRQAWADTFKAMAKFESAWNRTSRYHEKTMGTDPVTGKPVHSEGLMQLSYQDARNYKTLAACQEMDWSKDNGKSDTDPAKTIFDPKVNLICSMQIVDRLITKHGATVGARASLAKYWAVLKPGKCDVMKYLKQNSSCGIPATVCP